MGVPTYFFCSFDSARAIESYAYFTIFSAWTPHACFNNFSIVGYNTSIYLKINNGYTASEGFPLLSVESNNRLYDLTGLVTFTICGQIAWMVTFQCSIVENSSRCARKFIANITVIPTHTICITILITWIESARAISCTRHGVILTRV